jgi:hypothetical protein
LAVERFDAGERIERRQDHDLSGAEVGVPTCAACPSRFRLDLHADPTGALPERIVGSGGEAESWVKVAGDEARRSEHPVRRPTMPMEDSHAVADDPARRMHDHFAREVAYETDIMVSENDIHGNPFAQELREESKDDRTKGWGEADDRVLDIARDDERTRSVLPNQSDQPTRECLGGRLRGTSRSVRAPAEAEVQVRDHDGRRRARSGALQEQRRFAGDGAKGRDHERRSQPRTITLRVGSERSSFEGPESK